ARFALANDGETKDFDLAFQKIEQELIEKGIDLKNQIVKAHFICNLTIFDPKNNQTESFEGRVDGKLIFPSKGENGFGYDPIFIADGMDKTFGEIFPKEKDKISHRTQAFSQLKRFLTSP
ncbi:MAG: XTP/dITP diphosphohydrolase, partial [Myxococcota bacterium]